MIKAMLIDADGIVLKKRDKYFSELLKEDGYDVSEAKVKSFFVNVYTKIRLGKANLKEELGKHLTDWKLDKSIEELLEYWFSYEN